MPFTIPANSAADFKLALFAGQPGEMSQLIHLYLEEEGVLKKLELQFKAIASPNKKI